MKIYSIRDSTMPALTEVGGKGLSLVQSASAGLPVPPGFILSVSYFDDWLSPLRATDEFQRFLQAGQDELNAACTALKNRALELQFTSEQSALLAEAVEHFNDTALFAVRSSSPEEDLAGSSFAGGYETVLGVSRATIEDAVRRCFASCLDVRVVLYKREHGFDVSTPKIAVVIQEQIASEISGVGFSLNPVTNNFDEAVFNANWGLGETVVAGTVTPDSFTVDRLSQDIRTRDLGTKETSIWLDENGGTSEKLGYRSGEVTLSDPQLVELTNLINTVEKLFEKPIDIEWAFAKNQLYLLQARPITAYVPVPPEMLTEPGKPKRLYLDATISLQGVYNPLSPMATSLFRRMIERAAKTADITAVFNLSTAIPWVSSGRIYVNLSNVLALGKQNRIAKILSNIDPIAGKIIASANSEEYKSKTFRRPSLPPRLVIPVAKLVGRIAYCLFFPDRAYQNSQKALRRFRETAYELAGRNLPFLDFVDRLFEHLTVAMFNHCVTLTAASRIALQRIKIIARSRKGHDCDEFRKLEFALPHNPTTEMGLALFDVSQDADKWNPFIKQYGHRGPGEIDIASQRYRENPQLLQDLLESMRQSPGENPREKFAKNGNERLETFQRMQSAVRKRNPIFAAEMEGLYRVFETLGGYREAHKFYLILVIDLIRTRVLKEADAFLAAGRLDNRNQVFDLTLDQFVAALEDPDQPLKEWSRTNREPLNRLVRVRQLPTIFDSRGLILRPKAEVGGEGEFLGTPISAGTVRGRVKVLRAPDEKPLLRGEILVARATDPGWTPLFINAAGVILETGGLLQHGALVAREYGLPCVAGIVDATDIWPDGTLVEVDGSAGIVRMVTE
jgi:pyruvate,water dikinase